MTSVTVEIDDELFEVIKIAAKLNGVSVGDFVNQRLDDSFADIKARMNDPIIGLIDSGQTDISERDEEILRAEWRPD